MKTVKWLVSIGVTFTLFATVVKGFTIDGAYEAGYGSALSTQVLATTANSGVKNNVGLPDQANGSELDAAYGTINNGVLYLFFAGNLDSGSSGGVAYDKLHVFIMSDSGAGGDHTLGTNYSYDADYGHPNRMGVGGGFNGTSADPGSAGLTFDSGFTANYDIEVTAGLTNVVTMYANLFEICSNCPGYYLGSATPPSTLTDSGAYSSGIQVALNDSNTNGVWGDVNGCYMYAFGGSTNNPLAVTNGVEMAIPLSAIGSPQASVSICVFISDDACDALYNQVLGPVWDGTTDGTFCEFELAVDSSEVDFSNATTTPGKHYFTIPVPSCNSIQISYPNGFPYTASFPSTGGTSNVVVTAACSYTASASAGWVTVTSGSPGSGSGVITYSVATNTSLNFRTANLYIVGTSVPVTQTVAITQDGITLPPLGSVVIDGTKDPGYGCPLAVQVLGTGYGNTTTVNANHGIAGGSELDAAYGLVQNNTLFLLFTGNLQNNNNDLHIFFMTGPGGLNTLTNVEPTSIGGDVLNVMGTTTNGAATPAPGLTFDPGFAPNYWLGVNIGSTAGFPYILYVDYAQLWPGGTNAAGIATNGYFVGSNIVATSSTLLPSQNPFGIQATVNNTNTNGVDGVGCATNNTATSAYYQMAQTVGAALVTNGVELAIPLGALGSPTGQIAVCAFIGNNNGRYMSNQLLGPIDPTATASNCVGNLANNADANAVNFGAQPGQHSFVVGPEMRVTSVSIPAGTTNVAVSYLPENNTNLLYQLQHTFAPLTTNSTWSPVGGFTPGGSSVITATDLKAATNKVGVLYRVLQTPNCH